MTHVRECQQCGETYVPANASCPTCAVAEWRRVVAIHHIDHIRAYWLHRAMSIPGGASRDPHSFEYWHYIANMNSARMLSGGM